MKAISLWQPWASAITYGTKVHETRSWRPPLALVGQRLAIHAAKRKMPYDELSDLFYDIRTAARLKGWEDVSDGTKLYGKLYQDLPHGAILGHARLEGVYSTNNEAYVSSLSPLDYALGNYAPDRWAWKLDDLVVLDEPLPYKGAQGLFEVPLYYVQVSEQFIQEVTNAQL